jgi:hypothetical protein
VTILIFIILCFVFAVDQVFMAFYIQNIKYPVSMFNTTLNKTITVGITVAFCVQKNQQLLLAQDLIFIIMRIIIPFFIMMICNIVLIKHIRKSRKRIIRGRNEKRDNSFTISVTIMNGSFLICNIGVIAYYCIVYYSTFSGVALDKVQNAIVTLYGTAALIVSYLFTISQFFIDITFNKIFRKEIFSAFLFISGRRNQIEETRVGNTQNQNTAAN